MLDITSPDVLIFIFAGALMGGFINGLASFGTALFTLGFWLQIMPPLQAVSMILVVSIITGIQGFWVVRKTVFQYPKRISRYVLPSFFGIPLGIYSLSYIDAEILKLIIGLFMISYGIYIFVTRKLPTLAKQYALADGVIGFIGGFLGGLASLSGAVPSIWLSLHNWPKAEIRSVLQVFNLTVLSITCISLAIADTYTMQSVKILAMAIPVSIIGAQIGLFCFKLLNDTQFRITLISLMFISGFLVFIL